MHAVKCSPPPARLAATAPSTRTQSTPDPPETCCLWLQLLDVDFMDAVSVQDGSERGGVIDLEGVKVRRYSLSQAQAAAQDKVVC